MFLIMGPSPRHFSPTAELSSFGPLAKLMKRRFFAIVAIATLAVLGMIAWFWNDNASKLSYAEIEGPHWDKNAQRIGRVSIRADDPQLLAQVQPWRDALRREARNASFRRMVRHLQGAHHCENALRQPMERLTLVYENGKRESVGDSPVAFRKLLWAEDNANGGP